MFKYLHRCEHRLYYYWWWPFKTWLAWYFRPTSENAVGVLIVTADSMSYEDIDKSVEYLKAVKEHKAVQESIDLIGSL